ncbi:MAG: ATP-dependent DNA helicase RecG [Candidatus Portnoybacteria bacterium RIFCSPHIGHO2_01_FULL_40_12b]|uniref:ATP-dependent DNA helicase RecG n=1 Tax=Candidatus Portnoybacteria bacterium RIFCSPHIGHO2_01_FULL_40_12b TaxID=1801994 RepID=A0A1G2FDG7_9BACT|nr:MAG: ATP-dependent DNA helicase RecG [Candidatus Portnoybacteria bacterium RIFCSPHIGHO2_01_FULL_40_12b]
MDLFLPIEKAGRLYKMYALRLEKLNIEILEDFLYHVPFRYDDFSLISKINRVQPGEVVTIQGTVSEIKSEFTKNFKRLQKAEIADESGTIEVVWFNQPYLINVIHKNDKIALSGKIEWYLRRKVMQSPDYEIITNLPPIHTGRLVPVYPETKGITSKWLRRQVHKLIEENKNQFAEYLPDSIINSHSLITINNAIEQIHFPKTIENAEKSRQRLSFDELFLLQLSSMERKLNWNRNLIGNLFSIDNFKEKIKEFWKRLPFTLTNAQKRVVSEIFKDLAKNKPMNRLLEGDVGSGKTVVSAIAMFLSHLNGFQSVLMAPTEILAQQHLRTISQLLTPFKIKVGFATGSQKVKIKDFDVMVGTHAVLEKGINFDKLGLVVIDEQQRFGVEQRAIIRNRGKNPHLLTMTATPIPRTIALTLYGDLDLSILDEMPIGRKQIKTWLVPAEKRIGAYSWIKKQIKDTKSQVFIVCPFIEESETMQTVRAAVKEFEKLKKNIFKNLRLGLLHGKMKAKEKEEMLNKFRDGKIDILVATPVVEVGIDIPNATIILIEASERFGLAQLHQLRGRVGRGGKQSYCLLFTESLNSQTLERLKAMEKHNFGAELAELDLRLRGPGEIYGTAQHGRKMLKIASFSDFDLIKKTGVAAKKIFPDLKNYPKLLAKLKTINLKQVSPD